MREAETQHPKFVGTPTGWRRVAFVDVYGCSVVGMVKIPEDWTVEVHLDETTNTKFCVGVSPDQTQVIAERWLSKTMPRRLVYNDLSEQQAAMGGSDATTLDHAGIVTALLTALTSGDAPSAVPARVFNLTQVDDTHTVGTVQPDYKQHGDIYYSDRAGKPVWWFTFQGRSQALRTMSNESNTRHVYKDGDKEIFFLFEIGADYLLESFRLWGGSRQRRHVQAAQASVTATDPPDVIEELEPQLVYDPNAFS